MLSKFNRLAVFFGVYVTLWCISAAAVSIEYPLPSAAQEAQAQQLFHALKCVVCEGQSLAESDATLAVQMRGHIREMLAEGKSEEEVLIFFRSRYGDRVAMTPPLAARTLALWAAPVLLILLGGAVMAVMLRRQKGHADG